MKKIVLMFIAAVISTSSYAQKNALVINDDSKFMYYRVNNISSANTLQRMQNVTAFLKRNYPKIKLSKIHNEKATVNGKGKLTLYNKGVIAGHEEGLVVFDLKVEFKEEKYRVMVSNFTFAPLQRNRYGIFTPVSSLNYPLEQLHKKVTEAQYENYTSQIGNYCNYLNQQLNKYLVKMDAKSAKPLTPPRISTKDW